MENLRESCVELKLRRCLKYKASRNEFMEIGHDSNKILSSIPRDSVELRDTGKKENRWSEEYSADTFNVREIPCTV